MLEIDIKILQRKTGARLILKIELILAMIPTAVIFVL
jgi:hypothetical protein